MRIFGKDESSQMTVCGIDQLPVDAHLVTAPFSAGMKAAVGLAERVHQLLNMLHQRALLCCCRPP